MFFSSFFEKKGLSDCCISGKGKKGAYYHATTLQ